MSCEVPPSFPPVSTLPGVSAGMFCPGPEVLPGTAAAVMKRDPLVVSLMTFGAYQSSADCMLRDTKRSTSIPVWRTTRSNSADWTLAASAGTAVSAPDQATMRSRSATHVSAMYCRDPPTGAAPERPSAAVASEAGALTAMLEEGPYELDNR